MALTILIVIIVFRSYSESSVRNAYEVKNRDGKVVVGPSPIVANQLAQTSTQPTHIVQPCYGFSIQYEIFKTDQRSICSVFISLRNPRGSLTVDHRIKESGGDLPDIGMRRANPDKYTEDSWQINERTFSVFENINSPDYEKTAFLESEGSWVGISLMSTGTKDRDAEFRSILKTFYCKNDCVP